MILVNRTGAAEPLNPSRLGPPEPPQGWGPLNPSRLGPPEPPQGWGPLNPLKAGAP